VRGNVLLEAARGLRPAYEDIYWAATPLGPVRSWSPALRDALDLTLNTDFPVTLFWGPSFVLLYNEAYVPLIADKHPAALGAPAREVFPEAWGTIGPMMEGVLAGQGATWVEDAYVPLHRRGRLEEAYFTFSYSPVRDDDGVIEGVMNIATESTRQVVDRRRLALLNALRDLLDDLDSVDEVIELALPLLRTDVEDLPGVEIEAEEAGDAAGGSAPSDGWVRIPIGSGYTLVVRLSEHIAPDEFYLGFLRLVATALGQALVRTRAHGAVREITEALQRTLLRTPPQPDGMQIAVRYLPAGERAPVGGDWYDAFTRPDGTLTVAVGDVTGHDEWAAAAMAQIRNLLRGVSYTVDATPSHVLSLLDQAMDGLAVGVYATAVLAQIAPDSGTLEWSNAGHPPPVLIAPDGDARLLHTPPETLLGLGGGPTARNDHALVLEPGATVVFYTDGLVERRPVPLQERLTWLTGLLEGGHRMSAEDVCDHVLAQLDGPVDDDVALLVLRAAR
jgi:hypothetical protein